MSWVVSLFLDEPEQLPEPQARIRKTGPHGEKPAAHEETIALLCGY
jgi:hypothetical protein